MDAKCEACGHIIDVGVPNGMTKHIIDDVVVSARKVGVDQGDYELSYLCSECGHVTKRPFSIKPEKETTINLE